MRNITLSTFYTQHSTRTIISSIIILDVYKEFVVVPELHNKDRLCNWTIIHHSTINALHTMCVYACVLEKIT